MAGHTLARGANTSVAVAPLTVVVAGAQPGTVDLSVFQLGPDRRVRSDADFVFFNQPQSPEGAVRLVEGGAAVAVDLARVPAAVDTLAVAVSLDQGQAGSLAHIPGLGVVVGGVSAPASGLTTERAAVLVELYRRAGGWKVRNVSAGWDGGFADLVREHGVSVDDEPAAPAPVPPAPVPPAPVPTPVPAAPAVRMVKGEETLSLDKRRTLDLRKQAVHTVLLQKKAAGERARVVLVIDKTGSMHGVYRRKTINRVVERMVPVATQLDDDGQLEPYLYAVGFARLPDITVTNVDQWSETFLHLDGVRGGIDYGRLGGHNVELPILKEVAASLRPGDHTPTLVLFFTDGGFGKRKEIAELMRAVSSLPAFWQFVGIGKANYGLLEQLDTLSGRAVDNAGFFALDDIDKVDDAELYRRLLSEFPDWLAAARAAGIVGA